MSSVLFVCTGNICRSPSAEALLRHHLKDDGHVIDSAGTHGYHIGSRPDKRALEILQAKNVATDGILARKFEKTDFQKFDLIIAMDEGHFDIIKRMEPDGSQASVVMFTDYCVSFKGKDVPDPYYGDMRDFEIMMDILEEGIKGLLSAL